MTFLELRNAMELGASMGSGKKADPVPDESWPKDMLDSMPTSMLELMRRFRWEQGWQGSGPFCQQALQHTLDRQTLRECCLAIDEGNPPRSLREAYGRLGFPSSGGVTTLPGGQFSLRDTARRVLAPDAVPLRFLSYNTYLLQGIEIPFGRWIDDEIGWDALDWFGIPFDEGLLVALGIVSFPGLVLAEILSIAGVTPSSVVKTITGIDLNIHLGTKPAFEARSREMGPALSPFDVCCLCEVWTNETRDHIVSGLRDGQWRAVSGPDDSGSFILAGSGLLFLAKNRDIVRTERMIYGNRGERNHDSDAWSNKGVLLNEIDLGFANVEFYQTHLYYGGGIEDNLPLALVVIVKAAGSAIRNPTDQERMSVWRDELKELSDFYQRHHNPANIAIITGDFNMSGSSLRQYVEIRRVMDGLGMRDLWAWDVYGNEPSEGLTCRFTDGDEGGWVRNFDAQCDFVPPNSLDAEMTGSSGTCNDHRLMLQKAREGVGRYDFLFLQMPAASQRGRVEVCRSFRRPFRRVHESDGEVYLSDHMGMDVTLFVSKT